MLRSISLWCFSCCVLAGYTASGQQPSIIIEQYLKITSGGNPGVWKSIHSVSIESMGAYSSDNYNATRTDPELMPPSYSRHLVLWPDKDKIENFDDSTLQVPIGSFYFLKDKRIVQIANLPAVISPPSGEHFFEFLPAMIQRITSKNNSISFKGEEFFKKDSATCYRIDLTSDKTSYRLYFDKNTNLLRYLSKSNFASDDIFLEYAPYKKYGPILIPAGEAMTRKGVPYYWMKITKVEINPTFPPDEFIYTPRN